MDPIASEEKSFTFNSFEASRKFKINHHFENFTSQIGEVKWKVKFSIFDSFLVKCVCVCLTVRFGQGTRNLIFVFYLKRSLRFRRFDSIRFLIQQRLTQPECDSDAALVKAMSNSLLFNVALMTMTMSQHLSIPVVSLDTGWIFWQFKNPFRTLHQIA